MKKFVIYLMLGFVAMFLFTYIVGIYDDAYTRLYRTGVWYRDVIGSLKYYVLWVLPYWWIVMIIGAIVIALIFYLIRLGITKLKMFS